jgi:hypothetical protein
VKLVQLAQLEKLVLPVKRVQLEKPVLLEIQAQPVKLEQLVREVMPDIRVKLV